MSRCAQRRVNGPALHNRRQGATLLIVEPPGSAGRLAVQQSWWPLTIEAHDPVPDDLQTDTAGRCCLGPTVAVINHRRHKRPLGLIGILRRLRQSPQLSASKSFRRRIGLPWQASSVRHSEAQIAPKGNARPRVLLNVVGIRSEGSRFTPGTFWRWRQRAEAKSCSRKGPLVRVHWNPAASLKMPNLC